MLPDYHTHTEFSDDSEYGMEACIKDAIAMGMPEICFTDHVDYGIKYDWDEIDPMPMRYGMPIANVDYPAYVALIHEMQDKYKEQISIKMGLEFGMQMHTVGKYQKLFDKYPWDFILLSIHQIMDLEFWTQDFQKGYTQQEYNLRYWKEMLDLVTVYKDYSVLAHMDLFSRYDRLGVYPFEYIKPYVEAILEQVISDGKGIEFNTSYHRYKLNDTTPSVEILKLYKEMGGKIITVGSDSHRKEHLGAYFNEAADKLRELGFTEYYTFEKMEPIPHSL